MLGLANSLLLIAKNTIAKGSVIIKPSVKIRLDALVQSHINDKMNDILEHEYNRERNFNASEWHSKFEKGIKEARKDLWSELEKESRVFINAIEKGIRDKNTEELKDVGDLLWNRYSWYIKNDKFDYNNKDQETHFMYYRRVIQELSDYLEAFTTTREDSEEQIESIKKDFAGIEKKIFEILNKMVKHLEPIAKEIGRDLIVDTELSRDVIYEDEISLNFSVDFKGSDLGVKNMKILMI